MVEKKDEKPDAIICNRVADRPAHLVVEGSLKIPCSECGLEVWITPKTLEVKDRTGAKVVCIPCILPKLKPDSEFTIMPGQIEEVADHIRKEIQKN